MKTKDKILAMLEKELGKYLEEGLVLGIVSFSILEKIRPGESAIHNYAFTLIPVPPKDHEDNLLRDHAAKEVSTIAANLTGQVYGFNS